MGFTKLVGVLMNNYTKTLEIIKVIPNNHHRLLGITPQFEIVTGCLNSQNKFVNVRGVSTKVEQNTIK